MASATNVLDHECPASIEAGDEFADGISVAHEIVGEMRVQALTPTRVPPTPPLGLNEVVRTVAARRRRA